jgi:hypothetical protein
MLGTSPQTELLRLAAQTQMSYAQMQQQAVAQAAMKEVNTHIEVPQVNFYPSTHPKPSKARRKDIKQAYKLLTPTKRGFFSPKRLWGGKYRYNTNTMRCCVDGCDVEYLLRMAGNIYEQIKDDETGQSLWDIYFKNPVTGEIEAFIAREKVTSGRKLRATYCPEHLHLYHLLIKWEKEDEKEEEATTGTLKAKLKKGVSTVAVPITALKKKDNTPPILAKYEQFFAMLKQDNIPITTMTNSATGMNDLVMVVFDMRQFQAGNNARLLYDALAMHQMKQNSGIQGDNSPLPLPQQSNDGAV